jgi:hypothetical protein
MRNLWSDGWNSFWHFTFGALAYKIPLVLFMFLAYQAFANNGLYEKNVSIDILEFFIGLISMTAMSYTLNQVYEIPPDVFTEIIPDIISII